MATCVITKVEVQNSVQCQICSGSGKRGSAVCPQCGGCGVVVVHARSHNGVKSGPRSHNGAPTG